jgi:hypothetical protein
MPKTMPGNAISPYVSGNTEVLLGGELYGTIEETRIISAPTAAVDLAAKLPRGAVVTEGSLQLIGVTATTAVKVGIGRKEATADPDKYALSGSLANGFSGGSRTTGILSDAAIAETLQITACDTAGAAAGTINSGTIIARVSYRYAPSLPTNL